MGTAKQPITHRSLFSWVWASNLKLQLLLLMVILLAVASRVLPLEMQKRIVNQAINLRKIDLLFLYCGIYLGAVLTASMLKFFINYLQTRLGQQALAQMRKQLYHHILTLPITFFRQTQPGMVVSSIVNELTPAGNFVGMAVAVPVTNILTLLAFAGYLIWLNPLLGLVSLSIYPIVLFVLPVLQKRANQANKKRVDATRDISSKIAESITGIHEVHGHGAFKIENRKFDAIVERLEKIRVVWSLYKFGVKTVNNLFNNFSPFLIFILGGYLAMQGRLELGALVAFLSAQEKLYDPWREMIDFYQIYQDASVSYRRTMNYFDAAPEHQLEPVDREPYELDGSLEIKNLAYVTDGGIRLLENVSLALKPGEHLALVGFSGSGKSTLALCIGQLYKYTDGNILIGQKEVAELSKQDVIHNVGFVSQEPFIFEGTIEENLLYACLAQSSGNGGSNKARPLPSLDDMIAVLHQTGIFVDVLHFGLLTILSKDEHRELMAKLIQIRNNFQLNYGEQLAEYVEFYNENDFLYHSSIAENLILGTANDLFFDQSKLVKNSYFMAFLGQADLTRPLLRLGADLARQTVDILGNLPPDEVLFETSPLAAEEFDEYKAVLERLKRQKLHQLSSPDQQKLLELALRFTPGIHIMVGLPRLLEALIVEGRALFREKIASERPGAISFYEMSEYISSQSILNNILFGKTKTTSAKAREKINQSIIQLLIEEDLLETILKIGMQYHVGSKGDKLSGGQRQKLAIARAILKAPKIMILDEATSALDNRSQRRIQNVIESNWKGHNTLISVVHRLDIIKNFDKVAVMKAGKIVELGTYDELLAKKGMLYELVAGKK